jgi:hypothetical protein
MLLIQTISMYHRHEAIGKHFQEMSLSTIEYLGAILYTWLRVRTRLG